MTVEIVVLGTASTMPTKERNHASIYFRYHNKQFLFDCGEGTQRQMTYAKKSAVKIESIFLSHLHGDHIFGLPGLIQTSSVRERSEPLKIYGPKGTKKAIKAILDFSIFQPKYELIVKEVSNGVIEETEEYTISCFPQQHDMPCVGYVFQEKDKVNVNEMKLRNIGLPPGPIYKNLKEGKPVQWQGRTLEPEKFLIKKKGLKIVYSGDSRPTEEVIKNSENADLLIHEATFKHDAVDKAKQWGHSTAKEAAEVAREANVKQLLLTHFSARYDSLQPLLLEAKKVFENTLVAKDFDVIEL